tara:strand:+ start:495 stop:2258 length:1764 start_codon:yes stop_codon:yes gene_type:complete
MNGPDNNLDQKNLVMAIALSVLVLMVWQSMMPPPVKTMPNQPVAEEKKTQPTAPATKPQSTAPASPSDAPAAQIEQALIEHKAIAQLSAGAIQQIELSNLDGQISRWTLLEEQYGVRSADPEQKPSPFAFARRRGADDELTSHFLPPTMSLKFDGRDIVGDFKVVKTEGDGIAALEWTDTQRQLKVIKRYTLDQSSYTVQVEVELINLANRERTYEMNASFGALQNNKEAEPSMFMPPLNLFNSLCMRNEDFERLPVSDIAEHINDGEPQLNRFGDGVRWAGMDNRYFMTALLIENAEIKSCAASLGEKGVSTPPGFSRLFTRIELQPGALAAAGQAGSSVVRKFKFYGGPKTLSELNVQDPPLGEAIDFGFFSVICVPMLWLMRLSFEYIPNWGIAIIILTIFVKLLTLPLTIKQYKSMAAMKKIQPLMKALQAKYSEDKVRMQQEMMKLYKEHQVNPLAGCLPMVMMMPIYFALYRTIYSAVELYQANFGGWLTDLSQQDPYYITPVLLGLLMIIQFRLNPSAGDQTQTKILMWVMPIMFTAMMLFLPSGLVLYILVNTVLGIAQQWYSYRKQDAIVPQKARAKR